MGASANVQSIAVLKEFRVALCLFAESARSALGEADSDVQRHSGWLNEDRGRYWQSELKRRAEQHQRAKLVLLRKKLEKTAGGSHASCVDEQQALAKATRQLEEAQQKAESSKRWVRRLDELVFQHKGMLQTLHYALDNDVVNMLAMLDRMVEALDKYIALAAPAAMEPQPLASESASMTRPVEEKATTNESLASSGKIDTAADRPKSEPAPNPAIERPVEPPEPMS